VETEEELQEVVGELARPSADGEQQQARAKHITMPAAAFRKLPDWNGWEP